MNRELKNSILLLFLLVCCSSKGYSEQVGHISGTLVLDTTWEKRVYLSFVETFEKEYAVSNNFILTSAEIDSLGNFKIDLDDVPVNWSLLRLHLVKKGSSPISIVIGGMDENFYLLVAKRDSEIHLYNTADRPLFKNTRIEGAPYMETFDYIRNLYSYPNTIDFKNSLIEKEFIEEVVSEKLKVIADTSTNPLVSLYAIYQTDFYADNTKNPAYYEMYLSKWEHETSPYFESFRSKFPPNQKTVNVQSFHWGYVLLFILLAGGLSASIFILNKKNQKIKKLSVQERKIFDLVQRGLSNKEISAECNIELSTVKSHVSNIYSKLNIKSRREAINVK